VTSSSGSQTEADDVWPPTIDRPAVAPDTRQRQLRRGRFALLSALTGIGVPAFTMGALMLLPRPVSSAALRIENILSDIWPIICLLGLACEIAAVITGTTARKTWASRWGMAIPLLALCVPVVLVLLQHHMNGTWPWGGFRDDCGCDRSEESSKRKTEKWEHFAPFWRLNSVRGG